MTISVLRNRGIQGLILVVLVMCLALPANAIIVLSGDTNLNNGLPAGSNPDPGNSQFFTNVLGGGTTVAIGSGANFGDTAVNNFYNGLGGVSSSILGGPITGASLTGVDLFVGVLPTVAYTANEITVMSNFLTGGGDIFFMGDNGASSFLSQNTNINAALAGVGSGMSIVLNDPIFDIGIHTAVGGQIAAHPLTTGVATLVYAAPSQVVGGTTLILGTGGQRFVAVEGAIQPPVDAVPEPLTATLGLMGLGVLGMATRRRAA
jgi:hypothetical protein